MPGQQNKEIGQIDVSSGGATSPTPATGIDFHAFIQVCFCLGIVGGVLGGWVFSLFGIAATGIIGSLVTSIVGAILLLWIVSLLKRSDIS